MNSNPEISVVIPCYNHGEFLKEAVDSILAQTMQDFEIIVVDDGSTDLQTRQDLKALKLPKTRVLRRCNGGTAAARNTGIRAARGQYIFTLDADDFIKPTYFEEAMRAFASDPQVGIVHCRARLCGSEAIDWSHPPYSPELQLFENCIHSAAFFPRELWQKVGGYNESRKMHFIEDHDFWLSILELGYKPYRIEKSLAFYRRHPNSKTSRLNSEEGWKNEVIQMKAMMMRRHFPLYLQHAEYVARRLIGFPMPPKEPLRIPLRYANTFQYQEATEAVHS